jgi:hypothetical protein
VGKTYFCKLMEITNSFLSFLNTMKHPGNCTLYFVLGVKCVTCLCVLVCMKVNLHYYIICNSFIRNQLLLHPANKEKLYFIGYQSTAS